MQRFYQAHSGNAASSINFIWLKAYSKMATCIPRGIEGVEEWRRLNPKIQLNLWIRASLLNEDELRATKQLAEQYALTVMDFDRYIKDQLDENERIADIVNLLHSYGEQAKSQGLVSLALMEQVDLMKICLGAFLEDKPYIVSDFDIKPIDVSQLLFSSPTDMLYSGHFENYFIGFGSSQNSHRSDILKAIINRLMNLKRWEVSSYTGVENGRLNCINPISFDEWKLYLWNKRIKTIASSEIIKHDGRADWRHH